LLMLDPEVQWRLVGHDVEVKVLAGDHASLLAEPQVTEVAREITAILRRMPERGKGAESLEPRAQSLEPRV